MAVAVGGGTNRAEAQFGMGYGGGFGYGGWGGFSSVPKPESFVNSLALVAAARPSTAPNGHPYANDSNSYINHVRDNGFVERYSADRQAYSSYGNGTRATQSVARSSATPTETAMLVARPKPRLPLDSFYKADNTLAWPVDAPVEGEMKEKRATFDQASQVVLAETKKNGVASVAAVTDARQKLVDYGKPALQYVRTHETARLADTYHLFLLSLYESLSQAANPPATGRRRSPVVMIAEAQFNSIHGPTACVMTGTRFFRDRSRWMTLPSRPIKTLLGISATP